MLVKTKFQYGVTSLCTAFDFLSLAGTINSRTTQFGFVFPPNMQIYPDVAIGSLKNSEYEESDFTEFHSGYRTSVFYDFYTKLQDHIPFKLGRMRLMIMKPKTCLTIHTDKDLRYHIAIRTNENCLLMTDDKKHGWQAEHIPTDGFVYQFDARKKHTAINASETESRIHLVVGTTGEII